MAENPAVPVDAAAPRQVENGPLEFVPELEPRHSVLVDDRGGLELFRRQLGGQNSRFFSGGGVDAPLFRGEEIPRQVPVFAPRRRDDVPVDQTFSPFRIVEVRRVPFVGQGPGNGSRVGGRVQKERFAVLHFDFAEKEHARDAPAVLHLHGDDVPARLQQFAEVVEPCPGVEPLAAVQGFSVEPQIAAVVVVDLDESRRGGGIQRESDAETGHGAVLYGLVGGPDPLGLGNGAFVDHRLFGGRPRVQA